MNIILCFKQLSCHWQHNVLYYHHPYCPFLAHFPHLSTHEWYKMNKYWWMLIVDDDFSLQLSLRVNSRHLCGASVISLRIALSAAHCFDGGVHTKPKQVSLRGGSTSSKTGGQLFDVKQILLHPLYTPDHDYDVAIIYTKTDLQGQNIKPIQLPDVDYNLVPGSECVVSGWGQLTVGDKTSSEILRHINVSIVETTDCNAALIEQGGVRKS